MDQSAGKFAGGAPETRLSRKAALARARLIEATIHCVTMEGAGGASIRRIAERAEVSIGVINYHYQSIQNLIADAYAHLAGQMLRNAIAQGESFRDDPRRQLSAYLCETFSPQVMDQAMLRAWLVFWSMIESAPAIRDAHDRSVASTWAFLEDVFARLHAIRPIHPSPRLAAIGLSAMIDGLWLEWCLQPENFTRNEALDLCEAWLDAVWPATELRR